ncbi:hypothetical protein BBK82_13955 [Lentzea guizhouensis]|uniref:Uncharacterized protein n=1 Tax=Lentzea guizhouensis TaxID=1586287 RepID=A0A1B2HH36_9PSEU|nr:hypothetical protein BBK82_13955 [Lentzea guizhouensis]
MVGGLAEVSGLAVAGSPWRLARRGGQARRGGRRGGGLAGLAEVGGPPEWAGRRSGQAAGVGRRGVMGGRGVAGRRGGWLAGLAEAGGAGVGGLAGVGGQQRVCDLRRPHDAS